jgi:photosystem II stability/assembly factor-like uncharacterized protein
LKRPGIAAALSLLLGGAAPNLPATAAEDAFAPATAERWPLPNPDLFDVTARGSQAWAVGYWGSVLRSSDAGATWRAVRTPTTRTLYAVSFADERSGWAVGATGVIVRSTDGGATWRAQSASRLDLATGGEVPLDSHLFGVSAVGPNEAWAVGDFGAVLHTVDGETWRPVPIPADLYTDENTPERIFNAVHFADASRGWIAGEFGTVLRTQDGGATWLRQTELRDASAELYLYAISRHDAGPLVVSGLAGRVLSSPDEGASFDSRAMDTSAGIFAVDAHGERLVAVGDRGVLYVSSDGGASWRDSERPRLFNWLTGVTSVDERVVLVVGESGLVLRSADGGERFRLVAGEEPPPESGVSVPDVPGPQRKDLRNGGTR